MDFMLVTGFHSGLVISSAAVYGFVGFCNAFTPSVELLSSLFPLSMIPL